MRCKPFPFQRTLALSMLVLMASLACPPLATANAVQTASTESALGEPIAGTLAHNAITIESKICTVESSPSPFTQLLATNNGILQTTVDHWDTLAQSDGVTLHSAPRITVAAWPGSSRLLTRTDKGVAELDGESAKHAWLDTVYAKLPTGAYRPENEERWSFIADLTENAEGVIVGVRIDGLDDGHVSFDYLVFYHTGGQLRQMHRAMHIPFGTLQLLVLPTDAGEPMLIFVEATLPASAAPAPAQ